MKKYLILFAGILLFSKVAAGQYSLEIEITGLKE